VYFRQSSAAKAFPSTTRISTEKWIPLHLKLMLDKGKLKDVNQHSVRYPRFGWVMERGVSKSTKKLFSPLKNCRVQPPQVADKSATYWRRDL
jgi:hypothetical protein